MQGRQLSFRSREAFWVCDSPKVKSKVPKGGNDQSPATTRDKNRSLRTVAGGPHGLPRKPHPDAHLVYLRAGAGMRCR